MGRERHVVVTGAGGSLGAAVVEHMAEQDTRCHATWHRRRPTAWAGLPRIELHQLDCSAADDVHAFFQSLPAVDASIHVAGGFAISPIENTQLHDFESMIRANAVTTFLCCREALRRMRETGTSQGRIVNVAAKPVAVPMANLSAYAASKAAVASLTQTLALEAQSDGILINAVLPSIIDTPPNREAMPSAHHEGWPKPEEIARAIAFLASEANTLTSGALVPVYGCQ